MFLVYVAKVNELLEVKIVFLSLSSWNVTITFSSVLFDICVINVFKKSIPRLLLNCSWCKCQLSDTFRCDHE